VVAAVVVLVVRQPRAAVPGDEAATRSRTAQADASPSGDQRQAASALLDDLSRRLQHGTSAQATALGADRSARRQLATLARNVRTLGVTDLSMRYVTAEATPRPAVSPPHTWVAQVQVSWRLRGFDADPASVRLPLSFSTGGGTGGAGEVARPARLVSVRPTRTGDTREAEPIWMLGPLSVARTPHSLVVTSGGHPTARYSRLADRAVADVRRVLPRWSGRLVVEVPGGRGGLTRVLGADPSDYTRIAAVTTTADGSARTTAPVHIFVNARVFDPLGPRGSQVVMSHEATHVATGAALSAMPTWLLEGFADYVALDHAGIPVEVAASQTLARVRADGAPAHLPGSADFDAQHRGLGAAYESAWLACRLLGRTYGERRLVRLYRAVDGGTSTAQAFRTVLGTDQVGFTAQWRDELRRLAAR
jgi:hypothetical protein